MVEVPVVVRDDLAEAGMSDAIAVAENQMRAGLTALEEAVAMKRLRDAGRTQADIAKLIGCSKGHVSKRLHLLDLPETTQTYIASGKLAPSAALVLLDEADSDPEVAAAATTVLADGWASTHETWTTTDVRMAVRDGKAQIAKDRALAQLVDEGTPVVDTIPWNQIVRTKTEINTARREGNLVAHVDRNGAITYATTTPPAKDVSNGNTPAASEDLDRKRAALRDLRAARTARHAALPARHAALPALLATPIPAADRARWARTGAHTLLLGYGVDYEIRKLLEAWWPTQPEPGDTYNAGTTEGAGWADRIGLDPYQVFRAIWAAQHERGLRIPHSASEFHTMPTIPGEYAEWLTTIGHPLTPLENTHYRHQTSGVSTGNKEN